MPRRRAYSCGGRQRCRARGSDATPLPARPSGLGVLLRPPDLRGRGAHASCPSSTLDLRTRCPPDLISALHCARRGRASDPRRLGVGNDGANRAHGRGSTRSNDACDVVAAAGTASPGATMKLRPRRWQRGCAGRTPRPARSARASTPGVARSTACGSDRRPGDDVRRGGNGSCGAVGRVAARRQDRRRRPRCRLRRGQPSAGRGRGGPRRRGWAPAQDHDHRGHAERRGSHDRGGSRRRAEIREAVDAAARRDRRSRVRRQAWARRPGRRAAHVPPRPAGRARVRRSRPVASIGRLETPRFGSSARASSSLQTSGAARSIGRP